MSYLESTNPSRVEVGPTERSRRAAGRILQAMQKSGTGDALAVAMKTSASTISRIKNDTLEASLELIYQLGFKVVESDRLHVQRDELNMLRAHYARTVAMNGPNMDLFGDMD